MIVTYFRSSSYNMYSLCPQQYFIHYCLGWSMPSGKKAEMGTIVHKVMEILAHCKRAHQDKCVYVGENDIKVDDIGHLFTSEEFVKQVYNRCYEYYTQKSNFHFTLGDYNNCWKWICKALTDHDGFFDPRNSKVLYPEVHFDFELPYDWAKYDYVDVNGNKVVGSLALKGTIDLVIEEQSEPRRIWEVIDYKTGRRLDWASGDEKDYKKLCSDPQLRLYHYALHKNFPNVDQFVMTIYFINDGGPFTMAYTNDDLVATEQMLKERFETIKKDELPRLIKGTRHGWKCTRLCHFGKTAHPSGIIDPRTKEPYTICEYIAQKNKKFGFSTVCKEETVDGHDFQKYNAPG